MPRPSPAVRAAMAPAAVGAVAFVARLWPVLHGGGLTSVITYDDGVYYAASTSLVSGRAPYRDFLLLHPPGVTVLLAPFAELGRLTTDSSGLAVARLALMAVGAVTAVLVCLLGRRVSASLGLVAGLFYALWLPAVHAENTTLLEPWVNLGLAVALLLLGQPLTTSTRRVVLAGAALGLTCSVKAWGVVPLVVLAVWVWRSGSLRRAAGLVAGAVAAFLAVCLPFFALAPGAMTRMVLVDQLRRTDNGQSLTGRLANMTGLTAATSTQSSVSVAFAAACLVGVAVACWFAWRQREARLWIALLVVNAAVLLTVNSYFDHYGDFLAVPFALVVGTVAARALAAAARVSVVRARAVGAATAVLLVAVAFSGARTPVGDAAPRTWLGARIGAARCVSADSAIILIETNTLSRSLDHGCTVVIDFTGLSYDLPGGPLPAGPQYLTRVGVAEWQRRAVDYLRTGDVSVLGRADFDGFDATTQRWVDANPLLGELGAYRVYDTSTAAPYGAP